MSEKQDTPSTTPEKPLSGRGTYTATVTRQKHSQVEIVGEVSGDSMEQFRAQALERLVNQAELPGFRKGRAPANLVLQTYGEMSLWESAAEEALRETYPRIVEEHSLDVLGSPDVHITKLAPGNPLGFSITVAVLPMFTVPDYTALARNILSAQKPVTLEEKEVDEAISAIRRISAGKRAQDKTDTLPELTDELVQTFGEFSSVADFRAKVTESIQKEKQDRAREKIRWEILQNIAAHTTPPLSEEIPQILIEHELDRMLARLSADVVRANMKLSDYWQRIQKTESAWRTEATPTARERVSAELILNAIAKQENLSADPTEVEAELAHLKEHHTDVDVDNARAYFTDIFTKEKVFSFLEQSTAKK